MAHAWNPDLLIGHSQIDEQHKMLFQILEKLVGAVAEHKEHEEVGKALAFLSVYVGSHFKLEEDLMAQFDFEGLSTHRDSHAKLTAKVEQMVDWFHDDRLDPRELVKFLESWLVNHILKVDQLLADFLNASQKATG